MRAAVTLAGLILEMRRRGPRVSFMLDDRSGRIEVTLFEEVYQRYRELIVKDALVQVEGALRFDEFSDAWRLAAKQVQRARGGARAAGASADPRAGRAQASSRRAWRSSRRCCAARAAGQCSVLLRYRGREAPPAR